MYVIGLVVKKGLPDNMIASTYLSFLSLWLVSHLFSSGATRLCTPQSLSRTYVPDAKRLSAGWMPLT